MSNHSLARLLLYPCGASCASEGISEIPRQEVFYRCGVCICGSGLDRNGLGAPDSHRRTQEARTIGGNQKIDNRSANGCYSSAIRGFECQSEFWELPKKRRIEFANFQQRRDRNSSCFLIVGAKRHSERVDMRYLDSILKRVRMVPDYELVQAFPAHGLSVSLVFSQQTWCSQLRRYVKFP